MIRKKIYADFVCVLQNYTVKYEHHNVWDGIEPYLKKILYAQFKMGSLRVTCTTTSFFYDCKIELGNKIYNLAHYMSKENIYEAAIYDFEKGWLAPLHIPLNMNKPIMVTVPPNTSVQFSFSTVW